MHLVVLEFYMALCTEIVHGLQYLHILVMTRSNSNGINSCQLHFVQIFQNAISLTFLFCSIFVYLLLGNIPRILQCLERKQTEYRNALIHCGNNVNHMSIFYPSSILPTHIQLVSLCVLWCIWECGHEYMHTNIQYNCLYVCMCMDIHFNTHRVYVCKYVYMYDHFSPCLWNNDIRSLYLFTIECITFWVHLVPL